MQAGDPATRGDRRLKQLTILVLSIAAMLVSVQTAPAQTAKAAGLPGQWHFVLDTPGGDRESEADLKLDGEKVSGTYGKANVDGTFKDGKIALAFNIDTDEAGSGTLKLNGALDGDAITGDWSFSDYSGTFKATRKPAGASVPPPGF